MRRLNTTWSIAVILAIGEIAISAMQSTWTEGSHRDDVRRIQWTPDSIRKVNALGKEVWTYGLSTIEISIADGRVREWANYGGNLRVTLQPAGAGSGATAFSEGSHRDDVLRIQGTPDSIRKVNALGKEVWTYGLSTVEISIADGRVREWANYGGNLKASVQPIENIQTAAIVGNSSSTMPSREATRNGVSDSLDSRSGTSSDQRPSQRYRTPPNYSSSNQDPLQIWGWILVTAVPVAAVIMLLRKPTPSSQSSPTRTPITNDTATPSMGKNSNAPIEAQDHRRAICPSCQSQIEAPFVWLDDGGVECQHCWAGFTPPWMKSKTQTAEPTTISRSASNQISRPYKVASHEPHHVLSQRFSWWWPSSGLAQGVFVAIILLSGLTILVEPTLFILNIGINYLIAVGVRAGFIKFIERKSGE